MFEHNTYAVLYKLHVSLHFWYVGLTCEHFNKVKWEACLFHHIITALKRRVNYLTLDTYAFDGSVSHQHPARRRSVPFHVSVFEHRQLSHLTYVKCQHYKATILLQIYLNRATFCSQAGAHRGRGGRWALRLITTSFCYNNNERILFIQWSWQRHCVGINLASAVMMQNQFQYTTKKLLMLFVPLFFPLAAGKLNGCSRRAIL